VVVHLCRTGSVDDPTQVGFVVSRAVGGAVVRNRVKRRLRAQMAAAVTDVDSGCLLVVRALPSAATATWDELGHDLRAALTSAGRDPGHGSGSRGAGR
jgi:ribonuclease P protein component